MVIPLVDDDGNLATSGEASQETVENLGRVDAFLKTAGSVSSGWTAKATGFESSEQARGLLGRMVTGDFVNTGDLGDTADVTNSETGSNGPGEQASRMLSGGTGLPLRLIALAGVALIAGVALLGGAS